MDLPSFVQIEPVGQCNLRCRMCPIEFRSESARGHPPAFMPFHEFRRIIDQFPGLTELHLQGLGEPLMHLHFFDMVRYAADCNIHVSTNTNLTILTEERAEACVRSGLNVMHVSIDGATAEVYESIRIRARFDKVLRNLRRLQGAKLRLESTLPEVRLVCVVMRDNLADLPALIRLAHAEGVQSVSVQHLCHDFGESSLPLQYTPMREFIDRQTLLHDDPVRVDHYFTQAREIARELDVSLRLPNLQPKQYAAGTAGRTRCDWPWRAAYISYDGQAMPCCMVATPDRASFGSMIHDGVKAVWNNNAYNDFRDRLESDMPPEICRSCAVYTGTF